MKTSRWHRHPLLVVRHYVSLGRYCARYLRRHNNNNNDNSNNNNNNVCNACECSLRQVKIEQRKLTDNSNSLIDMAKVRP